MKLSLDVAIFGSSFVSAYRNSAATYYRGVVRALAARGHRITFYEPVVETRQRHRDLADPTWADVVAYSATDRNEVERMLERARRADVIIKTTLVGSFDTLLEREVPRAVKPGATSILWDVDVPTTLRRLRASSQDPLLAVLGQYDVVFTHGGGPPAVRAYVELGARLCVPVYPAVDPTTHFPVAPDPRWYADMSLLANQRIEPTSRLGDLFSRVAERLPERTFLLGGIGWNGPALPRNVRAIGHVYTAEHNSFNTGARCVLGVGKGSTAENAWSPPARIFEAAGAGACLVTDPWEGLDAFLDPGREVLVAKNAEEMANIVRELDPIRAREVGAAGRARMLAHHTYAHRAKLVDSILVSSAPSMEAAS